MLGVDRFDSTLNHKYGVSAIIVNNEKGQDLVDAIDKANIGTLKIISLADVKNTMFWHFWTKEDGNLL